MTLVCHDDRRRRLDRERGFNGIDYVDVSDDQRRLTVFFLLKAPPEVTPANVRIEGGARIRDIAVTSVRMCRVEDPDIDDCMIVEVDRFGDYSTYRLCLVEADEKGCPSTEPMAGIDPRYACAEFSFKVGCPSTADCRVEEDCPAEPSDEPDISYLAKDYASLRQVILDRLALIMPEWRERHVPDVGIALVELLAYVGDYLSYHQDAVATEAYLETARQRTSVRRHARLVDYFMHEGCNARAWITVATDSDVTLPADVSFVTGAVDLATDDRVTTRDELGTAPVAVFEPVVAVERDLWAAHSEIHIHTWGDFDCCLPAGATAATLLDAPQQGSLHLQPGDVLIFEELIGPRTGDPADADPRRRHVVVLTRVEPGEDPVTGDAIVEVEWSRADALPFALCLSTLSGPPACEELTGVSVARGNVILVDHGRPVRGEVLGPVGVALTIEPCDDDPCTEGPRRTPRRFRPVLQERPLTFATASAPQAPAEPRRAVPQVALTSLPLAPGGAVTLFTPDDLRHPEGLVARLADRGDAVAQALRGRLSPKTLELLDREDPDDDLSTALREALVDDLRALREPWTPEADLLASAPGDAHFVVELDNGGFAHLRFGDGVHGRLPRANAVFMADYRVGNGPEGNVGAETITRVLFDRTVIRGAGLRPRNPLPASGGTAAEPIREAKLRAPTAFRRELARAVTADDYARLAERRPGVQRAAATLRWSGSWPVVRVAVDPLAGTATQALLDDVRSSLEPFRRVGHDVHVVPAVLVPLWVCLVVCVEPRALRAHVEADLRRALGSRRLAGGALGFFHPDALTFGRDVYVSALVARAAAVPGVESARVVRLQRLHGVPDRELEEGVLRLGSLEVAQMEDDPNFPEHGRLDLTLEGGR